MTESKKQCPGQLYYYDKENGFKFLLLNMLADRLIYYLVVKPFSLLPIFVLYRISDMLAFLLGRVFRYRRKVILNNLQLAFPEKTTEELNIICLRFYSHLSDVLVETISVFSRSKSRVGKMICSTNPEVLQPYLKNKRSVMLMTGHNGNWELASIMLKDISGFSPSVAVFLPLNNTYWNEKVKSLRSKFGTTMVSAKEIPLYMKKHRNEVMPYAFVSDQTPANPQNCYWMKFLNQPTAMIYGPEKLAKALSLPVFFARVNKIERGKYTVTFEMICEDASQTSEGYITRTFNQHLENTIRTQPEFWLWSHRRWKHKAPANAQFIDTP